MANDVFEEMMEMEHHHGRKSVVAEKVQHAIDDDLRQRLAMVKDNGFTKKFYGFVKFFCSTRFESGLGFMILTNCILIGVEVQQCPPENSPRFVGTGQHSDNCPVDVLGASEHFFTAFFLVEFILRIVIFGLEHYHPVKYPSTFADGVLVWLTGVLPTWILSGNANLRQFTALRAMRLLRVARVVRMNPAFKEMWLLLKGLGDSTRTLFWTVVVMVFVNYLFGIFAVLVIGDSDLYEGTEEEIVQTYFAGLDQALYTLLQVVTGDAWSSGIARLVLAHQSYMWLYFVCYVGVAMFVLLNLITAVIVDNAMEISKSDDENRLRELHAAREEEFMALKDIFLSMDDDGSGGLDRNEFEDAVHTRPDIIAKFHLCGFHDNSEIMNLFNDLDDGDGCLTIEEFVEGLRAMQGEAKSKDIVKLSKALSRMHKDIDEIKEKINAGGEDQKDDSASPEEASKANRRQSELTTKKKLDNNEDSTGASSARSNFGPFEFEDILQQALKRQKEEMLAQFGYICGAEMNNLWTRIQGEFARQFSGYTGSTNRPMAAPTYGDTGSIDTKAVTLSEENTRSDRGGGLGAIPEMGSYSQAPGKRNSLLELVMENQPKTPMFPAPAAGKRGSTARSSTRASTLLQQAAFGASASVPAGSASVPMSVGASPKAKATPGRRILSKKALQNK